MDAANYTAIADERDAALAEVARLRKLFDDAGQGEHNVLALIDHYQDAEIKASAEVARLREALEGIVAMQVSPGTRSTADEMANAARAALGRTAT